MSYIGLVFLFDCHIRFIIHEVERVKNKTRKIDCHIYLHKLFFISLKVSQSKRT